MTSFQNLTVIKSDDRGTIYSCDKLKSIHRKKGTVSANHVHPSIEILYLLQGSIEVTIGEEVTIVSSPTRIEIPANIYHKVVGLTDFIMLEDRENIEV